jgi:hypothetical protein
MAFPDAQGTSVFFNGARIGGFVRFNATPATCSESDVTSLGSLVVGAGNASRVVRQLQPGPISPGTASVEMLAAPTLSALDVGGPGRLVISGPWGEVDYEAFPTKFTVSGSVGELVRTTMEFQFT